MPDTAGERATLTLDGVWDFKHERHEAWRSITVPAPWQAECPDLRDVGGRATYRRSVQIPDAWAGRQVSLRFGAVAYACAVTVNGREVGHHEGGYLPFEMILAPDVLRSETVVEVAVTAPTSEADLYPDHPFPEIPHGKQSWYGMLGGLWQSASLEARAAQHVAHCAIAADGGSGRVEVRVELAQASGATHVRLRATDPSGALGGEVTAEVAGPEVKAALTIAEPRAWSPDHPDLYRLAVEVLDGEVVLDRLADTFGFRTMEARDGRLFLNGEPLYLRGALDQDYYPEGICTPPSLAFLEDQLRKAKHLGLNCLRCHIKVPDPRYYEVADRLGMLIWTEIPNVERFTPAAAGRLRETFAGILRRDGNHPSIVIWTVINEDWGTRLVEDPEHRAWLRDTYDWVKALDPTRLVVDNSACHSSFHVKTDINDYHYYRSLPERRDEWDALTDEFASGPDWTYTPNGDGTRTGREPLVLSEFGVWGLPHPDKLANPDGSEPWWMEYGAFWGDGAAYPHGIRARFATLRLERVFGTFDAFIDAVQWQQFRNLSYQIASIRAHPAIQGYVITELTDVHWEGNGLLDLNRNPRVFHDRFAAVNADTVVVPKPVRRAFRSGEVATVAVAVAAGGRPVGDGAVLAWSLGDRTGRLSVPPVPPVSVSPDMTVEIALPSVARSTMGALDLTLQDATGGTLARTTVDLAVHAPAPRSYTVAARDPELGAYLGALGYRVVAAGDADVVVSRGLDAADVEAIRLGRRVLVLADGDAKRGTLRLDDVPREPPATLRVVDARPGMPPPTHQYFPGLGLTDRTGTMWRGDWISSFGWVRRSGPFVALPGGPLLDLSYDRVVPTAVLTGFQPWEYESRVHAGVVVGWVHKPAATIGERFFGRGKMVATTFRLFRDVPGADPVAAALLDALVTQAAV